MTSAHSSVRTAVEPQPIAATARRAMEFVERKGLGHPDTICDLVMEAISIALCREYVSTTGTVLHHNIDKGMLVAGSTTPALGGGTVELPMRLVIGDRATTRIGSRTIPVAEIVEHTARDWFRSHLRQVDPDRHLIIQNELRAGSAELTGIFAPDRSAPAAGLVANDTSVGVGFAPLTETELLVLAAEQFLNSAAFKQLHPESGEDVKVMAIRRGRQLEMTVAMAVIDRFISSADTYFRFKAAIREALLAFLRPQLKELDDISLQINVLDRENCGISGMYLTVLGTSAEGADGGEVGRGNRVNGLITFCRPMTLEAAAGKNPVSHVGKIYNLLARQIAERLCRDIGVLEEAQVWLCSRIGAPLNEPWGVSVQVALQPGAAIQDVRPTIEDLVSQEVYNVHRLTEQLARGERSVC